MPDNATKFRDLPAGRKAAVAAVIVIVGLPAWIMAAAMLVLVLGLVIRVVAFLAGVR